MNVTVRHPAFPEPKVVALPSDVSLAAARIVLHTVLKDASLELTDVVETQRVWGLPRRALSLIWSLFRRADNKIDDIDPETADEMMSEMSHDESEGGSESLTEGHSESQDLSTESGDVESEEEGILAARSKILVASLESSAEERASAESLLASMAVESRQVGVLGCCLPAAVGEDEDGDGISSSTIWLVRWTIDDTVRTGAFRGGEQVRAFRALFQLGGLGVRVLSVFQVDLDSPTEERLFEALVTSNAEVMKTTSASYGEHYAPALVDALTTLRAALNACRPYTTPALAVRDVRSALRAALWSCDPCVDTQPRDSLPWAQLLESSMLRDGRLANTLDARRDVARELFLPRIVRASPSCAYYQPRHKDLNTHEAAPCLVSIWQRSSHMPSEQD